jgi:hypothetical protein
MERLVKSVAIPSCDNHEGFLLCNVTLRWFCPECGSPRGEIHGAFSYDGSKRLDCHGWDTRLISFLKPYRLNHSGLDHQGYTD